MSECSVLCVASVHATTTSCCVVYTKLTVFASNIVFLQKITPTHGWKPGALWVIFVFQCRILRNFSGASPGWYTVYPQLACSPTADALCSFHVYFRIFHTRSNRTLTQGRNTSESRRRLRPRIFCSCVTLIKTLVVLVT